jgi:hypothetical protein
MQGNQAAANTLAAQENELLQKGELLDFVDGYYGRHLKGVFFVRARDVALKLGPTFSEDAKSLKLAYNRRAAEFFKHMVAPVAAGDVLWGMTPEQYADFHARQDLAIAALVKRNLTTLKAYPSHGISPANAHNSIIIRLNLPGPVGGNCHAVFWNVLDTPAMPLDGKLAPATKSRLQEASILGDEAGTMHPESIRR